MKLNWKRHSWKKDRCRRCLIYRCKIIGKGITLYTESFELFTATKQECSIPCPKCHGWGVLKVRGTGGVICCSTCKPNG